VGKVYLFVPGNSNKKIQKALNANTDAIIIDLEDAVTVEEKENARHIVSSILNSEVINTIKLKVYVRINSFKTPWFFDDIKMVKELRQVDGIMIPKCDDRVSVTHTAEMLGKDMEIIPLIESAAGVMNVDQVLSSHRFVRKVAFGSVDFALDIGTGWSEEGLERTYAMSKIVLTSRALGADSPIDAVFPVIDNKEKFIKDAQIGKQAGFYGKMVIHPNQIEWVKEVYTPHVKQIEWSNKVVNIYESSPNAGAIDLDGKLIDRPVYLLAKRILAASR
jgi:citrate lyase subunit beta / citryl-CoA lyase